jgi:hypothetical protein
MPTKSGNKKKFRPDLTDYEIYIATACDLLNDDALHKISKTDFAKMAIEKALKTMLPNIAIKSKRKRYITLDF